MKKPIILGIAGAAAVVVALVLVLAVEGEPKTAEEQWARAERMLDRLEKRTELAGPELRQEQDQVLEAYRAVGTKFPPGPLVAKAVRKTAELLLRWKRADEVFAALKDFAEKHKEDPAAPDMLWGAIQLILKSKPEEAIALYRAFAERYPQEPRAPRALLEIALTMKELKTYAPDEVRAVWQELLDKFPKSDLRDQAMLGIAEFYKEAKAFDEAVKQYDKVVEEFEGKDSAAKALLEKGRLLADKMDKKEEAQKTLEELEKKHPGSESARQGGGRRRDLEKELKEKKAGEREENFLKEHFGGAPGSDFFRALPPPTRMFGKILDQELDLERVEVDATVDPEKKTIEAAATIRLVNRGEPKTSLLFHLLPTLKVSAASVDGAEAQAVQEQIFLKVALPKELAKDATLELKLTCAGTAPEGAPMRLGKDGYAVPGAYWFPTTVYGDLFTGRLTLKLPAGLDARGTGVAAEAKKEAGAWTHSFEAKEPVFGLFFAYGAFKTWTDGPVTLSAVTEGFPLAKEYLAAANAILKYYNGAFGPLPWARIDIVEAELPEHIGGVSPPNVILLSSKAMASKTVPVSLLAHELAHQWWGNLVPIAIQKEDYAAWLSEGLACYSDAMYLEQAYGRARMEQHLSKAGLTYLERMLELEDVEISKCFWAHPQYFAVTYMKGSVAFDLLRRRMGDAPFSAALRAYAADFRNKPAGLGEFRGLCEKSCGKPLGDFFAQWVERKGFPHFKVEKVEAGATSKVTVRQSGDLYSVDLPVLFEGEGRREQKSFAVSKETEVLEAATPFKVEKVTLDPAGVLLKRPGPHNEWSRKSEE